MTGLPELVGGVDGDETVALLLGGNLEERGVAAGEVGPDVREALAWSIATARSCATLLDEINRARGRTTIREATAEGLPFFVAVDSEVLAVDLDDDDAALRGQELYVLLLLNGLAPVLIASGRSRHRHVFCRVPSRRRDEMIRLANLTPADVRATIRPPLSPHRSGEPVTLLAPQDPEVALSRLRGVTQVRRLGARARHALNAGATDTAVSGSEVIFSVAMGGANAGWTVEDLVLVVASPTVAVQRHMARRVYGRGVRHAVEWLVDVVWVEATSTAAASPPQAQDVSARHAALAYWVLTTDWSGRTAATDRAVYLGLLRKRISSNCSPFDASHRELCLLAGISSLATLGKSLRRLEDRGVLERYRRPRSDDVVLVRLSDAWTLPDPMNVDWSVRDVRILEALDALGDDAFRNGVGLGKSLQHLVLLVVCRPGMTTDDLAALSGRTAAWVTRGLRTLQREGLVELDTDGTWVQGVVSNEVVAKEIGVNGRGLEQLKTFNRERDNFDRPPDRWDASA